MQKMFLLSEKAYKSSILDVFYDYSMWYMFIYMSKKWNGTEK